MTSRLTLLLSVAVLALSSSAQDNSPATPGARPETALLQRNFHENGKNPYDFDGKKIEAKKVETSPKGVRVTFADGHTLDVPADGEVKLEILRQGKELTSDDTFRDAFSASFLVEATPEQVNHAIRDVPSYPKWFKDKKKYCHTYYTEGTFLDRSKHPAVDSKLKGTEAAGLSALKGLGYTVDAPESKLLQLKLKIGVCNFLVKSDAAPALATTCYRARSGNQLVAVLNENFLAWPDTTGGAQIQNVVWVIEPVTAANGKSMTLVRYIYASDTKSEAAKLVKNDRWEMSQKNVIELCNGIRDLALDLKKRGVVK